MSGIGFQLRSYRDKLGLSLRDVEKNASTLAQEWGNGAYKISASWLDRVEREDRGLSGAKLLVLSYVYNLTAEQILMLSPGVSGTSLQVERVLNPNPSLQILSDQGPADRHICLLFPDKIVTDVPANTQLLETNPSVSAQYRHGVVGSRDKRMEPMLLGGAIVLIDTQKKTIAGRKDWVTEYDRPVYFLRAREGYFCGFCELDKNQEWLRLVPHPLSHEPESESWRYMKEVEVVGTVTAVYSRRSDPAGAK